MREKSLIDQLHEVQSGKSESFIPKEEAIRISKLTKVSLSEIYGVATFYTMFSVKPRGKHIIRICRSLSCHMAESEKLLKKLEETLGISLGETTSDGEFTIEESSCLGMCSVAPAMMIDDVPFGEVKLSEVAEIINKIKGGK